MQLMLTAAPDIALTKNNEGQTAHDIAVAGNYQLCVELVSINYDVFVSHSFLGVSLNYFSFIAYCTKCKRAITVTRVVRVPVPVTLAV